MAKILKLKGLILKKTNFFNDLALRVLTTEYGVITLIAKNAASPKSRRGKVLTPGVILEFKSYFKNHYYLNEFNIKDNLAPYTDTYEKSAYLYLVFDAIDKHFVYSNPELAKKIVKLLYKLLRSKDKTKLALFTFNIFYDLNLINSKYPVCNVCKKVTKKGYFVEGNILCRHDHKFNKKQTSIPFDFSKSSDLIRFFKDVLNYWEA